MRSSLRSLGQRWSGKMDMLSWTRSLVVGLHGRLSAGLVRLRSGLGRACVLMVGGLGLRLEVVLAVLSKEIVSVHVVEDVNLLRRSMSAGVTYCVPDIHWMLLMVGRGGMSRSGFMRISFVRSLNGLLVCVQECVRLHLQLQTATKHVDQSHLCRSFPSENVSRARNHGFGETSYVYVVTNFD